MAERCDRCPEPASVFGRDEVEGDWQLCYHCAIGEAEDREVREAAEAEAEA